MQDSILRYSVISIDRVIFTFISLSLPLPLAIIPFILCIWLGTTPAVLRAYYHLAIYLGIAPGRIRRAAPYRMPMVKPGPAV